MLMPLAFQNIINWFLDNDKLSPREDNKYFINSLEETSLLHRPILLLRSEEQPCCSAFVSWLRSRVKLRGRQW